MIFNDRGYTLSTGRRFYSWTDRLSVGDDGVLAYGHDSSVSEFEEVPLTPDEKREIAEYMIDRWKAWAAAAARCIDPSSVCPHGAPAGFCSCDQPMPRIDQRSLDGLSGYGRWIRQSCLRCEMRNVGPDHECDPGVLKVVVLI